MSLLYVIVIPAHHFYAHPSQQKGFKKSKRKSNPPIKEEKDFQPGTPDRYAPQKRRIKANAGETHLCVLPFLNLVVTLTTTPFFGKDQ